MGTKKEIRRECRRRRIIMDDAEVAGKSEQICRRLIDHRYIQGSNLIFVYSTNQNEVDLTSFVNQMWQMGKRVAFPSCSGSEMEFYEISDWNQLTPGSFGILEPALINRPVIPIANTVVCVPGIAFSPEGNRIGMGRGYYDRYLKRYPSLYKIGLAYELQMGYSWTPELCDIPMDLLITEEREIYINEDRRIMQAGS